MERTRAEDPPHCNPWRGSLLVLPHEFSRPPVSSEHHPSCSGVAGAEPSVRLRLLTRSATDSLDVAVTAPRHQVPTRVTRRVIMAETSGDRTVMESKPRAAANRVATPALDHTMLGRHHVVDRRASSRTLGEAA